MRGLRGTSLGGLGEKVELSYQKQEVRGEERKGMEGMASGTKLETKSGLFLISFIYYLSRLR